MNPAILSIVMAVFGTTDTTLAQEILAEHDAITAWEQRDAATPFDALAVHASASEDYRSNWRPTVACELVAE